jgi:hypothetical protein
MFEHCNLLSCNPHIRTCSQNAILLYLTYITGADPGFQVRGGALKKIAPSGGRREHFWGISCEKSFGLEQSEPHTHLIEINSFSP